MPIDLRAIITGLLPEGDDRLAIAMRDAMRPIVVAAFRQGLEIGIEMARDAAGAGAVAARRAVEVAFEPPPRESSPIRRDTSPMQGRKHPVPRGTIGPAISSVLTESPGLIAAEVEARVVELNPAIIGASVGNELRRLRGQRYRRDDAMRWYLIGDTRKETAEAGPLANGADSWVGDTDQAAA